MPNILEKNCFSNVNSTNFWGGEVGKKIDIKNENKNKHGEYIFFKCKFDFFFWWG